MFRIKWIPGSQSDDVYYLAGLKSCISPGCGWGFSHEEHRAIKFSFKEARRAVHLYFASESSEDGGKRDCLVIERIKGKVPVYEGYSKFHPDKKVSVLLDPSLIGGEKSTSCEEVKPAEQIDRGSLEKVKSAGRPYRASRRKVKSVFGISKVRIEEDQLGMD